MDETETVSEPAASKECTVEFVNVPYNGVIMRRSDVQTLMRLGLENGASRILIVFDRSYGR